MFKIGRTNTGENWAEKVGYEICREIGLPCAKYELATDGVERGVVSETFLPRGGWFAPGNTLLAKVVDNYDGSKRFRQIEYKYTRVLALLRVIRGLRVPLGWEEDMYGLAPVDVFVGYLVLDALIGNTDRHHENWGVVVKQDEDEVTYHLAPTFDHASSLGRNEPPDKRRLRLLTTDQRAAVEAYAARARSAFFGTIPGGQTLTQSELMHELGAAHPDALRMWAERVSAVPADVFRGIFEEIDPEWISPDAVEFAMRMVLANQCMIHEAAHAR